MAATPRPCSGAFPLQPLETFEMMTIKRDWKYEDRMQARAAAREEVMTRGGFVPVERLTCKKCGDSPGEENMATDDQCVACVVGSADEEV